MKHFFQELTFETTSELAFFNITQKVQTILQESGIRNGLLTIATAHTTTAIFVNENEECLKKDMIYFLNNLAPRREDYHHNVNSVDDRPNTHAHLQSLLLQGSQTLPVVEGKLRLGTWQSIFFAELDGPRASRQVAVQVIGE